MSESASGYVTTSDGVQLHYLLAGAGPPLVLLPGWTQPAAGFSEQLADLSKRHLCVALDPRCHGDSQRVTQGPRVSRLATDCFELLNHLEIEQVTLLGHSSGCVVIWSLIDLFGTDRVRGLVLCDQMAVFVHRPEWTVPECRDYGSLMGAEEAFAMAAEIEGPEGASILKDFIQSEFAPDFPREKVDEVVAGSSRVPRDFAAALMRDVMLADYRDVLTDIECPTLCIGGRDSHVGEQAMGWIASQIPNAELAMIDAGHFVYLENPKAFNAAVNKFLDGLPLK